MQSDVSRETPGARTLYIPLIIRRPFENVALLHSPTLVLYIVGRSQYVQTVNFKAPWQIWLRHIPTPVPRSVR